MKKLTNIFGVALLCSALAGGAPARTARLGASLTQDNETYTHKEAGVQFQLPKDWKAKPDGEVITVSSPDDALQVVFWVPDEETFDATVKDIDKELSKTIKNIKTTGKPTQDTHSGMAHYGVTGTGEVDGAAIVWSVDVLAAHKPLILLTFAAPNLFEKHAEEYAKLVGSIKKID